MEMIPTVRPVTAMMTPIAMQPALCYAWFYTLSIFIAFLPETSLCLGSILLIINGCLYLIVDDYLSFISLL